jgi:virginiamycin A acetyltransferase
MDLLKKIIYVPIKLAMIIFGKILFVDLDLKSRISLLHFKNRFIKFKASKLAHIVIKNSIVGDINIGEGCKIDNSNISDNVKLGRFVSLNSCRLHAKINKIIIGNFCSIAPNTIIQEVYHKKTNITTYHIWSNIFKTESVNDFESKGDILIEDDVWIGANSVVLSGVTIGRGSIIGAGSIVTKNIPPYSIAVGNPATVIAQRFNKETVKMLENSSWWKMSIEELNTQKESFKINLKDEMLNFKKDCI